MVGFTGSRVNRMSMKRLNQYIAVCTLILCLSLAVGGGPAQAEGLDSKPEVTITGYSFDYDAVSESENGLKLETSLFKPLMITNSTSDIFGLDPFTAGLTSPTSKSAPHGFAVAAEYLATPNLAFLGAIGVTKGNWDADASLETESSWEANLGVVYNFFNSLSYQVHFGYMDTGDLFEEVNTYSDIEAIIMISNQLTLSF